MMLWNYKQLSEFLNRSEAALRRDVMLKRLPVVKMFGRKGAVRFDSVAIQRLVERSTMEPAVAPAARGRRAGRAAVA